MVLDAKFLLTETRECGYFQDGRQATMDYYGYDSLNNVRFDNDVPAKYRKTRFDLMRKGLMGDIFSAATTACASSCRACIPLRINTLDFEITTRQQKKLDAFYQESGEVIWIDNPVGIPKLHQLFIKFLQARFPNSPMLEYDESALSAAIRSKSHLMALTNDRNQLLGFTEVDRLEHESALDFIVYDPDYSDLFLGVVSFLETVKWARDNSIPYVYIGPTNETAALKYKRYYSGLETFDGEKWVPYAPKVHTQGPDYDTIIQNLSPQRRQEISNHPNMS